MSPDQNLKILFHVICVILILGIVLLHVYLSLLFFNFYIISKDKLSRKPNLIDLALKLIINLILFFDIYLDKE